MIQFDFTKCGLSDAELNAAQSAVAAAKTKLEEERRSKKIGWWELPFQPVLRQAWDERILRFENLIVLGIGGSSQGLKALAQALLPAEKQSRLFVVESPDPRTVAALLKAVKPETACLNVISKSGNTIETLTLFEHLRPHFKKEQIVVTTEEGDGTLYKVAKREGLKHLPVPKNVGGRFSVFSNVGLFPLSFLGVDVDALLHGARQVLTPSPLKGEGGGEGVAFKNGLIHYLLNRDYGKTISVMMSYADCLGEFGGWYAQLWAESLGKEGKGQTPLVAKGPQDQHSLAQLFLDGPKDKVITFVTVAADEKDPLGKLLLREAKATATALYEKGCPSVTLTLPNFATETLGELLATYQTQTAFTGRLMGINPYDQPAVERVKNLIMA